MVFRFISVIFFLLLSINGCVLLADDRIDKQTFPLWSKGHLDIYHFNTGRGDAALSIFPDGTTLLIDAGDLDASNIKRWAPLKLTEARPDASKSPGAWLVSYIKQILPDHLSIKIDYALISHFHSDHYGAITDTSKKSGYGHYFLSGITEVGDAIPITILIDRHNEDEHVPDKISSSYKEKNTYQNYLKFINYHQSNHGLKRQTLQPGSDTQIVLQNENQAYPGFSVRNVKANNKIWTGQGNEIIEYFTYEEILTSDMNFNENPLSLAIKINYGDFDYFTGGDMTGSRELGEPYWFDVETPVGKSIGEVDVLALNHHGNRDATNANFLRFLTPRVLVQQSWISDHPGGEVLHRIISQEIFPGPRDLFATNMLEETKVAIGPWLVNNYKSMQGHIMIRVAPGGKEYFVYILDDSTQDLRIIAKHGPYQSR